MEDLPRRHDNNNNKKKTMATTINNIGAGAGSFGIGGIVMLGGALVTATLVSAFAFKTRQQRPSRPPSPATDDAPNTLELMMKNSKDRESSKDFPINSSLPDDHHNLSDGSSAMEEKQIEPTQNLILQKLEMIIGGEVEVISGNEELAIGEDQGRTTIYDDSGVEREDDNNYKGKTMVEDQVGFQLSEEESHKEIISFQDDDDDDKQNRSLLADGENDEHTESEALELKGGGGETEGGCGEDWVAAEEKEGIHYENGRYTTSEAAAVHVTYAYGVVEEMEVQEGAVKADYLDQIVAEAKPGVQFLAEEDQDQVQKEGGDDGQTVVTNWSCDANLSEPMHYNSEQNGVAIEKSSLIESARVNLVNEEEEEQVKEIELFKEDKEKEDHSDDKVMNEGETIDLVFEEEEEQVTGEMELFKEDKEKQDRGDDNGEEKDESVTVLLQSQSLLESENATIMNDGMKVAIADQIPVKIDQLTKFQIEMTEDELVEKEATGEEDEIPQVQLNGEEDDKNDEEDVTEEGEETSDGTGDSSTESNGVAIWPEEGLSPENISMIINENKSKENDKEDTRIEGGKEQDDIDDINDEKSSKRSSYSERFMMNLAQHSKKAPPRELPWKLKLQTWSMLVPFWCLCHWYFGLPFLKLSLVGIMLSILILLAFPNPSVYFGHK